MSRSGYHEYDGDDQWAMIRYRGAVASAIRGSRGQAFLREMAAALDAMPHKRLVRGELEANGEVCALGAVGRARGVELGKLNPEEYETVAKTFGISPTLAREIVFENDDDFSFGCGDMTPEQRWTYMREWIERQIKEAAKRDAK